jgi:DNA-binding NtrC family response regulator
VEKRPKEGSLLIVDDEPRIHRLFQKALSPEGFCVLKALSEREALKLLDEETVDVVLLDIVLPGRGGIDVLKEIKRRRPHLPVIIITGFGMLNTAREAMLSGAYDYVTKPFDLDFVKRLILQALEESTMTKRHR